MSAPPARLHRQRHPRRTYVLSVDRGNCYVSQPPTARAPKKRKERYESERTKQKTSAHRERALASSPSPLSYYLYRARLARHHHSIAIPPRGALAPSIQPPERKRRTSSPSSTRPRRSRGSALTHTHPATYIRSGEGGVERIEGIGGGEKFIPRDRTRHKPGRTYRPDRLHPAERRG